eukprot:TRINITY_DN778181_c0_g1_i1.p1 TRINITY_DN778181_c0_g1~~TRINITY_DN778181_c0_g1_i1.p1  ORF type:complete len:198 (-),score=45.24 TRINITY_DN778181_c0_g1_i1:226-819(-)
MNQFCTVGKRLSALMPRKFMKSSNAGSVAKFSTMINNNSEGDESQESNEMNGQIKDSFVEESTLSEEPVVINVSGSKIGQFKDKFFELGAAGFLIHTSISTLSTFGIFLAIQNGLDVMSVIEAMGLSLNPTLVSGGGSFVMAFAINKIFSIPRMALTVVITPPIMKKVTKYERVNRFLEKVPLLNKSIKKEGVIKID